jgi:hypothetical protein
MRPDPSRVHHGSQETTKMQERAREGNGECVQAFSNRAIDGRMERVQHDGGCRDVGISAALSSNGKALLVSVQREQVYRRSLILSLQVKTWIWLTTVSDRIT